MQSYIADAASNPRRKVNGVGGTRINSRRAQPGPLERTDRPPLLQEDHLSLQSCLAMNSPILAPQDRAAHAAAGAMTVPDH
jgi:hypothetical protein